MKVVRTQKTQTADVPLGKFHTFEKLMESTQSWKEIIMFFARTQAPHAWTSPQYQFTDSQQDAWTQMMTAAAKEIENRPMNGQFQSHLSTDLCGVMTAEETKGCRWSRSTPRAQANPKV